MPGPGCWAPSPPLPARGPQQGLASLPQGQGQTPARSRLRLQAPRSEAGCSLAAAKAAAADAATSEENCCTCRSSCSSARHVQIVRGLQGNVCHHKGDVGQSNHGPRNNRLDGAVRGAQPSHLLQPQEAQELCCAWVGQGQVLLREYRIKSAPVAGQQTAQRSWLRHR